MKPAFFCPGIAMTAACAESGADYTPILDGVPTRACRPDVAFCQSLARHQRQLDQETLVATVLGAGAGAVLGELNDNRDSLGGAIAGALAGGVTGNVNARDGRVATVVGYLRGRGHRVLG